MAKAPRPPGGSAELLLRGGPHPPPVASSSTDLIVLGLLASDESAVLELETSESQDLTNRLPMRVPSTAFPTAAEARKNAKVHDGDASPWRRSLNGKWNFRLFDNPESIHQRFPQQGHDRILEDVER